MGKTANFKVLFHYLKDEKIKVFIYMFLVLITYIPSLISAYFRGNALESLVTHNFYQFTIYLVIWESIYIIFYTILQIPRDMLYNYLEIKFIK